MKPSLILLAVAILFTASSLPSQSPHKALSKAPDFTRTSLDGKQVHLSNYRGKVVLLNFWATWCGPCIAEIPRFSSWQTKYGPRGFQVLGISMDDNIPPVQKAIHKYQLTYPIIMGDEHLGELFGGVLGLPVTFLISPEGKILAHYQGETDLNQLENRIATLLASNKPG